MASKIPPITTRLADQAAESVRRNHEDRIRELEQLDAPSFLGTVTLPNTTAVTVAHKLGRAPKMVWVSPARGEGVAIGTPSVGYVVELRTLATGEAVDRTRVIVLEAAGFGATALVDVAVF